MPEESKCIFENRLFVTNIENGKSIHFLVDFSYDVSRLQLKLKGVQGTELLHGDVEIEFTYSKIFDTFEARKVSLKLHIINDYTYTLKSLL